MIANLIITVICLCAIWIVFSAGAIWVFDRFMIPSEDKIRITELVKSLLPEGMEEQLAERLGITPEKLQERLQKHNWRSREISILPVILNFLSTVNRNHE